MVGAGGVSVSFRSLSESQARDLVGECQALQPLAVASWALILAAGEALPGLWSAEARRGPAPNAGASGGGARDARAMRGGSRGKQYPDGEATTLDPPGVIGKGRDGEWLI